MTKSGAYTFKEQKRVGEEAEATVESFLLSNPGTELMYVEEIKTQLKGIDFLVSLDLETRKSVEVKIDNICHRNGRYFLEIELVKANGQHSKDGWVHTTQADFLFMLVGNTNILKIVKPEEIRKNLYRWKRAYGTRECYNKSGYSSIGICTPFAHIRGLALDITTKCEQSVIDYMKSN